MGDLPVGRQTVVAAQSETIGLPEWSFFSFTVSGSTHVPFAEYDAAMTTLQEIVNAYVQERAEYVAREVGIYYGAEGGLQQLAEEQKQALNMSAFDVATIEFSYTQKETIGLPNKSKIENFGSTKTACVPGQEWQTLRYLAPTLARKLFEKRDVIKQNARPWTSTY
jgi:hypothetical protein